MRILIVDDHALFREGLCHVLNALDDSVNILEAADYDSTLLQASEHADLDLVLLDLNMPGKDGFAVLATFVEKYPALPVVMLSGSSQRKDIQRALDTGAVGYIPKNTTSVVILNALRLILSGGTYVPQIMAKQAEPNANSANSETPDITPRQLQVLCLLIKGCSNKEIANKMQLAEATIKMHVTAILKNLRVSNRTQAAMAAQELGLSI